MSEMVQCRLPGGDRGEESVLSFVFLKADPQELTTFYSSQKPSPGVLVLWHGGLGITIPASHVNADLNPGCSSSNPAPC